MERLMEKMISEGHLNGDAEAEMQRFIEVVR
jgi:hypothetical protein